MRQFQLHHILCKSAWEALKFQDKEGYFPKGHNGPWGDADTNVRTTAHWPLTTFKAYHITGEKIFLSATQKACDYLIRKKQRPYGYTFCCRTNETGKNMSNGLIGQAWAIEPLILIGKSLNQREYLEVAQKIVLLHKYNMKHHAWNYLEINGKILGINQALNQQIWFAALSLTIGKILGDSKLIKCARDFFNNLPCLISFFEEKGLISHTFVGHHSIYRNMIKELIGKKNKGAVEHDKRYLLSQGYLSFILYGLAMAYEYHSEETFWKDDRLKAMISDSIEYIVKDFPFGCGEKTGYRWCYNPTGIEMAYVLQVFKEYLRLESAENHIALFLSKQFEFYYDFEKNMLSKNTMDPNILSARLYEAVRLKNYNISISH